MRTLSLFLVLGSLAVIFCVAAVGLGALHSYEMPDGSMEPTLLQGDRLSEMPLFGSIQRGTLVAFHLPYDQVSTSVARVVALPGDHVRVVAGRLVLNGKPVYEPYLRKSTKGGGVDFPSTAELLFGSTEIVNPEITRLQDIMYGEMVVNDTLIVPENDYFVLGDNRGDSVDSRNYGPVSRDSVFARPFCVYSTQKIRSSPSFFTKSLRQMRFLTSPQLEIRP